jgi:F420-dependent oxidoreductase-like protein
MRLGYITPFSTREGRRTAVELARVAEASGLDGVWVPEAFGSDAFTLLGAIAAHTSRLRLATGIVNTFSRSPALLAQTFATLDELSNGRVTIGLGVSGPQVIERWHGVKFERPLRRMREVVEIVRLALAGERVNYEGECFRLSGFRLLIRPLQPRIPVYLATLKPQALELTGEIADGWLPTHVSLAHLPAMLERVAAGAKRAGRALTEIDVAPATLAAVSEPALEARRLCAQHLAYYVGGMGTFYHELMHRLGFGDEADRIQERWKRGDREGAAAQVSRAMLDGLVIAGTGDDCLRAIEARRAAGIDHLVLFPPHGSSIELVTRTLRALGPGATSDRE